MSTLLIAEHNNQELKESTLHAVTASIKLDQDVDILVAGDNCASVAKQAATIPGINKVILSESDSLKHFSAEIMAALIVELSSEYSNFVAPATTFGKNIMPRVASALDVSQISDITDIIDNKTFVRPIYAGNALATVRAISDKKVITTRSTAFAAASFATDSVEVKKYNFTSKVESYSSSFISLEETKSFRPELTSAKIVVSGGRGLASKENFALIEQLADKLNAAIGASRAAVDAGFVPNDYQVGQTGKIVAPNIYIAIGISGAIQHIAGIKDSKVIVAINKDEDAPIFQIADYAVVGDLFKIVPELIELL